MRNNKKTEQKTNTNRKKLFTDELWTAHAAFPVKKKNPSFKKPGPTVLSNILKTEAKNV